MTASTRMAATKTAGAAAPEQDQHSKTMPSDELKVCINGRLVPKSEATVSVYDHGLLYGDGVFEGLRSYGGKVFRLEEHLRRLWDSAKAIWWKSPSASPSWPAR
jgi:hypothetical protein